MHQLNNNECVRNEENRQYSEIALTEHNVANYINQLETIKQLRSFPGTSDLVLSTYDGWNEPIHSYYLALKAPKFWQSIYEQIETIITDDEQHPDSFYCIRTDENISINVPRVLVPDIEGRMLSIIVRTMYAGTVRLDYDLCWELLELANRFHLDFLISTCLDYLQRTLNINNCVLLLQTGLKFDHQLSSTSYRFILRNFIQIVRCSEILSQLTHQQLACILADDQLNIVNEVYGWRAIVTWITHSPSERLIHFWPLFSLIRCYLLHSSAIHNEMIRDYCLLNLRNGNILSNRNVITHFRTSSTPIFNPRGRSTGSITSSETYCTIIDEMFRTDAKTSST
ncbi:hypothetical protein RDWZM_004907 [Blomia tropicalis]|uniref:BACK domain-containing protein n=1 Tax=Blomia tropicalis TaxID=40697 RepID=A0A9Q0M858_BLOTA|nr:hypothetical protein RDWZM_004907 [Blomia tropicalis]